MWLLRAEFLKAIFLVFSPIPNIGLNRPLEPYTDFLGFSLNLFSYPSISSSWLRNVKLINFANCSFCCSSWFFFVIMGKGYGVSFVGVWSFWFQAPKVDLAPATTESIFYFYFSSSYYFFLNVPVSLLGLKVFPF